MHALLVFRELVGRQRRFVGECVPAHVCLVRVAGRARGRDVGREHGRLRVVDDADTVGAVAVRAGGDARVAAGKALTVHARDVLGGLIDALTRSEAPHQRRVTVAPGACGDLRLTRRLAFESVRHVVRTALVGGRCLASVTIDAPERVLPVDVLTRKCRGWSR
jgi:hypothetical protein